MIKIENHTVFDEEIVRNDVRSVKIDFEKMSKDYDGIELTKEGLDNVQDFSGIAKKWDERGWGGDIYTEFETTVSEILGDSMPNNCSNPDEKIEILECWSVPSICIFNPEVMENMEPFINNHKGISMDEIEKMVDEGKTEKEIINIYLHDKDRELYYENRKDVRFSSDEYFEPVFAGRILYKINKVYEKRGCKEEKMREQIELNKKRATTIAKRMLKHGNDRNNIIAETYRIALPAIYKNEARKGDEELRFILDVTDALSNESSSEITCQNKTFECMKKHIKNFVDSGDTKNNILKKVIWLDKIQKEVIDWTFDCLEEQERELKSEMVLQKMEKALDWEIGKTENIENEFEEVLKQSRQDIEEEKEAEARENSSVVIDKMKQAVGKEVGKTNEEEKEFGEVIRKGEVKEEDYI